MEDDDLIPLSALQHYLYCPRQCALIHVERLWAESRHTVEGKLLHTRTDEPSTENRRGIRTITAMPLVDTTLGIAGIADVVEYHPSDQGEQPFPVEYKRGRPKTHRADEVQLCAQALCIESMLGVPVPEGALFYGQSGRRKNITFDDALRALTKQTIVDTRAMIMARLTPKARYEASRCDACSLIDLCQPRWLNRSTTVQSWIGTQVGQECDDN